MNDCHQREFQVHAYCSCFLAGRDGPRCLVGLVEAQERLAVAPEPVDQRPDLMLETRQDVEGGRRNSEIASSSDATELKSVLDVGEVAISFRDDPKLPAISCTPGMTQLSG